jgi:hypothetical protein
MDKTDAKLGDRVQSSAPLLDLELMLKEFCSNPIWELYVKISNAILILV